MISLQFWQCYLVLGRMSMNLNGRLTCYPIPDQIFELVECNCYEGQDAGSLSCFATILFITYLFECISSQLQWTHILVTHLWQKISHSLSAWKSTKGEHFFLMTFVQSFSVSPSCSPPLFPLTRSLPAVHDDWAWAAPVAFVHLPAGIMRGWDQIGELSGRSHVD